MKHVPVGSTCVGSAVYSAARIAEPATAPARRGGEVGLLVEDLAMGCRLGDRAQLSTFVPVGQDAIARIDDISPAHRTRFQADVTDRKALRRAQVAEIFAIISIMMVDGPGADR